MQSTKTWRRSKPGSCLFFPDTYEVGMSHLGIRILYHILNSRPDTACERVFSPWPDYEDRLRASGRPLTSLESNLPLAEFDIIGITLQYELSYSNILTGLELAKIPIRSEDRNDSHPLIIAGGPCSVNPEPLSDFIDVFFIGEAEEAVHEIVLLRQQHPGKREFLSAISKQEGFYVPSLGKTTVRRRYLKSIETAPYPDKPLVPLMKPIHDRVTVEVARGCIRGCRFCQAGIIYRPYRERSPETVKGLLEESLSCTGYDELSLASLSTGDYSDIQPLIIDLMEKYRDSRISVSLPSLRVGTLTPEMIRAIAGTRKTGFTLAPEAGTERLRRVINKPVSDLDLMDAAETIFRSGWNTIKLYFMIGLPTETDLDLDGIIRLTNELFEPRQARLQAAGADQCQRLDLCAQAAHAVPVAWPGGHRGDPEKAGLSREGIEEARRHAEVPQPRDEPAGRGIRARRPAARQGHRGGRAPRLPLRWLDRVL